MGSSGQHIGGVVRPILGAWVGGMAGKGLLEESGAPLQAQRLDPFVEPSLCVTHLSARTG